MPMAAAFTAGYGWRSTPMTQMAGSHKAALLTFVAPMQCCPTSIKAPVGHYAWLTPTQMLDAWRWERPMPRDR